MSADPFDLDDFSAPAVLVESERQGGKTAAIQGLSVDLVIVDELRYPRALPAELELVVQKSGLELQTAQALQEAFAPLFAQAQKWVSLVDAINVTDASQVDDIATARETRLELKKVRVAADKTRKRLKDESLKRGKAIDGVYNVLEFIVAPLEKRLQEQEEFVERQEAARKAALKDHREMLLAPYGVDTTCYDLGMMTGEVFDQLLTTAKNVAAEREETARRIEAERIAQAKADADERERVRLENVRLKEEAVERDRLAEIERAETVKREKSAKAAADAVLAKMKAATDAKVAALKAENDAKEAAALVERQRLQAIADEEKRKADAAEKSEREAREKVAADLARREAEEAAAITAKVQAQQKAARAPDKEKLRAMTSVLRGLQMAPATTSEGRALFNEVNQRIAAIAVWAEQKGALL